MLRIPGVLAGLALGAAATAAPAAAQAASELRTVRFGVQGGLAMPTGEDADFLDTGFSVGGTIDWRLVNRPFGLRFDVGYQRLGLSDDFEAVEVDGSASVLSGTGAVVLSIPTAGAVRPYLLGGAGAYHMRVSLDIPDVFGGCDFDGDDAVERRADAAAPRASRVGGAATGAARVTCAESETKFGLHAGAGLAFPLGGIDGYVEGRFHSIFTEDGNTNVVPIVFGLRF
jgi:opacity protein-like surface antigen